MSYRVKNGAKVMNKEQWLQNKMYETKFIKIYFKDAKQHFKSSLKKSLLPIFEVLHQNIKTFQWFVVIESLIIK